MSSSNVHSALSQAIKDDTAGIKLDLSVITDEFSRIQSHDIGRNINAV